MFDRLSKLTSLPATLVPMGPGNPLTFTLLAIVFLLREVEASTSRVSAWSFDDEAHELTWNLPGSKSDHKALGVKRTWPCICGHKVVPCPYHMAKAHMVWLEASPHSTEPDAPLFPNVKGAMPSKATVVTLFEAIGTLLHQALWSDEGIRLFGGHSARVTGAQMFAAIGIDVNKIRILARHSGETIMRYVQDAPLRSLRSDLGLTQQGTVPTAFAVASRTDDTALQRRMHSLTEAIELWGLAGIAKRDAGRSQGANLARPTYEHTKSWMDTARAILAESSVGNRCVGDQNKSTRSLLA